MSKTFTIQVSDNGSIVLSNMVINLSHSFLFYGVRAGYEVVSIVDSGSIQFSLVPDFASVVTSDDGTFDIANAPAGFTPTTGLQLKFVGEFPASVGYTIEDIGVASNSITPGAQQGALTCDLPDNRTLAELIGDLFKLTFSNPGTAHLAVFDYPNSGIGFVGLEITGSYDIETFVEPNPNNPTNPDVFQPGVDTVTISSPGPPSGPDLTTITQIDIKKPEPDNTLIVSIPQTCFTTQNITILVFLLPLLRLIFNVNGCLPGPPYFPDLPCMGPLPKCPPPDWKPGKYNIFGVTFSGSVTLGSLYISLKNGSGIYSIVSGKTNDTIYINSPGNNQTMDFKIPNPFFKTGLIGG